MLLDILIALFMSLCSTQKETKCPLGTTSYKLPLWAHFNICFKNSMNSRLSFELYIRISNFYSKLCMLCQNKKVLSFENIAGIIFLLIRSRILLLFFQTSFLLFLFSLGSIKFGPFLNSSKSRVKSFNSFS